MTLKGNLEVLNLSDIFQSLSLNQHTGTLRVADGKREKLVHFAQGEITLLASEKKVKIGEMLVAAGKISAEDLDYALQQQKKSKKKLGEILIEEGFVSEDDIADIVKQQIEAEIYDLFLWKKAEFEFLVDYIPEKLKNPSHGITKLQFNTSSLIMEALRRLDEWGLISKEIPTLKEVYKVANSDPKALDEIELPDRVKAETKLIDGEKTLEQIAEETSLSEFELCKLVFELKSKGIVAPLTPKELSDRADEAFQKGKFRQAASLYDRLVEVLPKNLSIRWHLADSLKAFGDEARALEQYLFIAQAFEGTRDRLELAKAYRAILELAPDRKDVLEKLRALDRGKMQQAALRTGILFALLIGVGVGGYLGADKIPALKPLKEKLAALFASAGTGKGNVQEEERRAKDLLAAQDAALRNRDYKKAFDLGLKIVKEYPKTGVRSQVALPITIYSEPPGKTVVIDGVEKGTTDGVFQFFPKQDPKEPIRIEIREGARTLRSETVTATEYLELTINLFKKPAWEAKTQGAVRGAPVFRNGIAYFASMDGRLHGRDAAQSDAASTVLTVPLSTTAGEVFGYAIGGVALADTIVVYGTIDGDVKGFDVSARTRAWQQGIQVSDQPLLSAPVVIDQGATVVVAGSEGAVAFVDVRRQQVMGKPILTANRITADLAEAAGTVYVCGRDNRVLAIDAAEKNVIWSHVGRGDYLAAACPIGDRSVVVGDAAGEVACLDRKTGAALWKSTTTAPDLRGAVVGLDAAEDTVYVTTRAEELWALKLADGTVAWKAATPKRPGRPIVAGTIVAVGGDGAFAGFERASGKERWLAKGSHAFRGRPVFFGGRIYVGSDDGVLYAFDPE